MGDIAVPALEKTLYVYLHDVFLRRATQALVAIGTPKAVETLVRGLWSERAPAIFSALALGSQLHLRQVEEAVRTARLPTVYTRDEWYRWVWAPFEESESTTAVVAGRIGYLLDGASGELLKGYRLDPRIAIPLAVKWNEWVEDSATWQPAVNILRGFVPASVGELGNARMENPVRELLMPSAAEAGLPLGVLQMVGMLNYPRQVKLLFSLAGHNRPTLEHWRNIFKPVEFEFKGSTYFQSICLILFTLPALSLAGFCVSYNSISHLILIPALLLALWAYPLVMGTGDVSEEFVQTTIFAPPLLIGVPSSRLHIESVNDSAELAATLLFGAIIPANVFLGSLIFKEWLTVPWIIVLWVALLGPLYLLYWLGKRKERRAGNPLVGLLDEPVAEKADRSAP
jgi:hypothetical protein